MADNEVVGTKIRRPMGEIVQVTVQCALPQLSALREPFAAWAHWPVLKQHDQRPLRPPTPRKQTGSFRRKLGDFGTCTRGRARYKTIAIRPRRLGSNGFAGGCWPSQAGLSVLSFCQNASCHFVNRAAVGLFGISADGAPQGKHGQPIPQEVRETSAAQSPGCA